MALSDKVGTGHSLGSVGWEGFSSLSDSVEGQQPPSCHPGPVAWNGAGQEPSTSSLPLWGQSPSLGWPGGSV